MGDGVAHEDEVYLPARLGDLAAVRGEAELNAPAEQVFTSMVVAFGAIRSAARRETVYFKPEDFTP